MSRTSRRPTPGRARPRRRRPPQNGHPAPLWVAALAALALAATGCSSSSSGGRRTSDVGEAGDTGAASDTQPSDDGADAPVDGEPPGDADGDVDVALEAGTDADAGGPSVADACAAQAAVFCGREQECRPGAFLTAYGPPEARAIAACETVQRAICGASAELSGSGYDAAAIAACASAQVTASCDDLNGVDTWPCPTPRGERVNGAECAIDAQCASRYCRHWFTDRFESCGRCADRLTTEASCADDVAGCPVDAYCDTETFTCEARGAVGDECESIVECTWRCADGSCAEPAEPGDACDRDGDCDFYYGGQTCLEGECAEAVYVSAGETCDTLSTRCAASACIGGECTAYAGLDDPCGAERFCGPGLGCGPATSTCQFAPWLSVCD